MSKNPKPDYTEWFKRDTLRLKHLVNIAAQADPEGLPPEKGPWANIIEDLDYHIRLGHLEGIPGPQGVKRQTRVALEHLWAFVFGPDYIHHSRWNGTGSITCSASRRLPREPLSYRRSMAKGRARGEATVMHVDLMVELLTTPSPLKRQRRELEEMGVTREAIHRAGGLGWARVSRSRSRGA